MVFYFALKFFSFYRTNSFLVNYLKEVGKNDVILKNNLIANKSGIGINEVKINFLGYERTTNI